MIQRWIWTRRRDDYIANVLPKLSLAALAHSELELEKAHQGCSCPKWAVQISRDILEATRLEIAKRRKERDELEDEDGNRGGDPAVA